MSAKFWDSCHKSYRSNPSFPSSKSFNPHALSYASPACTFGRILLGILHGKRCHGHLDVNFKTRLNPLEFRREKVKIDTEVGRVTEEVSVLSARNCQILGVKQPRDVLPQLFAYSEHWMTQRPRDLFAHSERGSKMQFDIYIYFFFWHQPRNFSD